MVVPASAVEHFKRKGFKVTLKTVVSAGDLSSAEMSRIRVFGLRPAISALT
jgi:hypothetical protein